MRLEWESDAQQAIERAPLFVRGLARRKVEELARAEGRTRVTLADVRRAKDARGPLGQSEAAAGVALVTSVTASKPTATSGMPASDDAKAAVEAPIQKSVEVLVEAETGFTEEQIRQIEQLAESVAGHEERYYSVWGCGGAVGCPLTLVDVGSVTTAIVAAIEASGLVVAQAARIRGPVLSHHKLKIAVAGCPNACSEPQIKDFALIARSRPSLDVSLCTGCGSCVGACVEGAIRLVERKAGISRVAGGMPAPTDVRPAIGTDQPTPNASWPANDVGWPMIDTVQCVGCGACTAACPSEALTAEPTYDVLVGGRLGRHPRLTVVLAEEIDEAAALDYLTTALTLLRDEGRPGERLGSLIDRVGLERLRLSPTS